MSLAASTRRRKKSGMVGAQKPQIQSSITNNKTNKNYNNQIAVVKYVLFGHPMRCSSACRGRGFAHWVVQQVTGTCPGCVATFGGAQGDAIGRTVNVQWQGRHAIRVVIQIFRRDPGSHAGKPCLRVCPEAARACLNKPRRTGNQHEAEKTIGHPLELFRSRDQRRFGILSMRPGYFPGHHLCKVVIRLAFSVTLYEPKTSRAERISGSTYTMPSVPVKAGLTTSL